MSSEENNSPIQQQQGSGTEDSQRRSLNVNAKSFVPKVEEPSKAQPQKSPTQGQRTPNTPSKGGSTTQPGKTGSPNGNRRQQPPQLSVPQMAQPMPGMPFPGPMLASPLMMQQLQQQMMGGGTPNAQGIAGGPRMPMMPGMPMMPMMGMPGSPMVQKPHNAGQSGGIPPTPSASGSFVAPASPLSVNVGNATLNAITKQIPPKFACILLIGAPGVGKTTIGRQLVQELNDDKLGWSFFSGSDHIQTGTKKLPHETMCDVFDALNSKLDECLEKQKTKEPIRGLVIDKNCRGVEEVYYLSNLLHSKSLTLTAVVNLDVTDDSILLTRLGQGEDYKEKIKFFRVILSRIQDQVKPVGLWKNVDASKDRVAVVQTVRTMVLGCSAQPPTKQLHSGAYSDSSNPMVANYRTYSSVLDTLFSLVKTAKPGQFPVNMATTPLKEGHIQGRKAVIRDGYMVRRRVDGTRYILIFDGAGLYLVPRHMRAILQMPKDAWLGIPLSNAGKFVLDGDLVRLTKERQKEKFVVNDALFWGEKETNNNILARAMWEERQERLKVNLCSEVTAFFPKKGDCVVVHQTCEPLSQTFKLFDACDYSTDGLVFQPKNGRDAVIVWRQPECITVDFRLGGCTTADNGTRTYVLEVFDQRVAKYVQYKTDVVEITNNRLSLTEGSFVVCGLDVTQGPGKHTWFFQRVRTDVPSSFLKAQVDELLADCIIPKTTLVKLLQAEKLVEIPQAITNPSLPQSKDGSKVSNAARIAFGSALLESELVKDSSKGHVDPNAGAAGGATSSPATLLQRLKQVNPSLNTKVEDKQKKSAPAAAATAGSDGNAVAVLETMLSQGVKGKGEANKKKDKEDAVAKEKPGKKTPLVEKEAKENAQPPAKGKAKAPAKETKAPAKEKPAPKPKKGEAAAAAEEKAAPAEKPKPKAKKAKAASKGTDEKEEKAPAEEKKSAAEKPKPKPKAKAAPAKKEEEKAASTKQEADDSGSEGSDGKGNAADGKPKRRRRGARGGANRANRRKAEREAAEGGAAPAAPAQTAVA